MGCKSSTLASEKHRCEPGQAPWKAAFLKQVHGAGDQVFAFSSLAETLDYASHNLHLEPRARFCAFRCFWAELPRSPSNPARLNDVAYESDLPVFVTDARTHKTGQIRSFAEAASDNHPNASGGGGPCEAVWWSEKRSTQWRVRGQAYIIGSDIDEGTKGSMMVKEQLLPRMRVLHAEKAEKWSWSRELTAQFGNLASVMRGRYAAPPPGQPIDKPYDKDKLKPGQSIDNLHHPIARKNFCVIVIIPVEVEYLHLGGVKNSRRLLYQRNSSTGAWSQQDLWP